MGHLTGPAPQGHLTGILTGMRAESRLLRGLGLVACAGAEPEAAARALVAAGATRLMSFGLAGGLDPTLAPGTLVLATAIIDGDTVWPTDGPWRRVARGSGITPGMVAAPLLAVSTPLLGRAAKADAAAATGAVAVDLESGAVARIAAQAGLPLLALRAIADPARQNVPAACARCLDGQGRLRPGAALAALLSHPVETLRLAAQARAALAALRAAIRQAPAAFE